MILFALLFFDLFAHLGVFHGLAAALMLAAALVEFHFECWVMFTALMRLEMVRDAEALSTPQMSLGKVLLVFGYLCDVLLNVMATLWLLQPPFLRTANPKVFAPPAADAGWWVRLKAWFRDRFAQRQWLLSQRLEYNVYSGRVAGWRSTWSERFRRLYLDNIDPKGIHRS